MGDELNLLFFLSQTQLLSPPIYLSGVSLFSPLSNPLPLLRHPLRRFPFVSPSHCLPLPPILGGFSIGSSSRDGLGTDFAFT